MTIQVFQGKAVEVAASQGWMVCHVQPKGGDCRVASTQQDLESNIPFGGSVIERGLTIAVDAIATLWWRGSMWVIATGTPSDPNALSNVFVHVESFASDAPPPGTQGGTR